MVNTNPLEHLKKNQPIINSIYLNPTSPEKNPKIIFPLKSSKSCDINNSSNVLLKKNKPSYMHTHFLHYK